MTWDYIAGFIDGEGSITKRKKSYNIYISQTNRQALEEICAFAGRGYVYSLAKRKAHWRDAWLYSAGNNRNTLYILSHVVDKLIVKKEQAQKALNELTARIKEIDDERRLKESRIRRARVLRDEGWSYRKIARELKTDFGYVRRLVLSK